MPPQEQSPHRNRVLIGLTAAVLLIIGAALYYLWPGPVSRSIERAGIEEQPAIIILHVPNGGEVLKPDDLFEIRWESRGVARVYVSLVHGEKEFGAIRPEGIPAGEGRLMWKVPDMSGFGMIDGFKMLITNGKAGSEDVRDMSDGTFAIVPKGKG